MTARIARIVFSFLAVLALTQGAWAGESASCIPFDPANHQVVLSARVNGRDSLSLILDTGSQGSVLDEETAKRLGLVAIGRQRSTGSGGEQEGSTVDGVQVELPGFELSDQSMDTLSLGDLSAHAGRRLDGILGHPVFERAVVEIDYARRCVRLYDPERFDYSGRGAVVPIDLLELHPYVTARLTLPGGRTITGRFVIDTGASSSIVLSPDTVEREDVLAAVGKTITAQSRGIGGTTENRVGRAERLDIGGLSLAKPLIVLPPSGAGRVSAPGTLGNIGGGILRRFKVTFDYARRQLILERGPAFAEPFEWDMSGLRLATAAPEFRDVRVAGILESSPAFEAGIRSGDVVESVDGKAAAGMDLPELRARLRGENQRIDFVLRRGAERFTASLRTRRLI
jgi:predicted aspartyl protease